MKSLLALIGSVVLIGCHGFNIVDIPYLNTAPWITKGPVLYPNREEQTPVVFNGRLLDIVWHHDAEEGEFGRSFDVHDGNTLETLTTVSFPYGFISAIVTNGMLYVFGTSGTYSGAIGEHNEIAFTSTADLINWTAPQAVIQSPTGETFYNTSVAPDSSGFIMAAEFCVAAPDCYDVHFYHSTDLVNWNRVGEDISPGIYTACPMIRYSNGYYYVTFLRNFDNLELATFIGRSKDLSSWQFSPQPVLAPAHDGSDGINTSDMDMVEVAGRVRIVYGNGYQTTAPGHFINDRVAYFDGTQDQFFKKFFD